MKALLRNPRKTECGAKQFLARLVRIAHFALPGNPPSQRSAVAIKRPRPVPLPFLIGSRPGSALRGLLPALALALAFAGVARPDSLEDVLGRMDAAAKEFKSYSTDVKRLDYTKIIDEKDETSGTMRLRRDKNGVSGVMKFTSGQDSYTLGISGGTVKKYLPKANEVQIYNVRKSAVTLDQFLLLGFDTTREELLRDYDVTLVGLDKVGSVDTTRILLKPKSAETLKLVKTIELWFPNGKGYPIQQKGTEPSGNYKLATFSNQQVNPPLPPSAFEFAVPAGAKQIKEN